MRVVPRRDVLDVAGSDSSDECWKLCCQHHFNTIHLNIRVTSLAILIGWHRAHWLLGTYT